MKEEKFLPEGYRFLKEGEQIKKDDYFWSDENNKWLKIRYDADTANWIKEHVIRSKKKGIINVISGKCA